MAEGNTVKAKHTFQVQNVKCEGCATTIKNKLEKEFGVIEIDLTKTPKELTLEIENEHIDILRNTLKTIGYPMTDEQLGFFANRSAQTKSFVSCALGRIENAKKNS